MTDHQNKLGFSGLSSLVTQLDTPVVPKSGAMVGSENTAGPSGEENRQSVPRAGEPASKRRPPPERGQEAIVSGRSRNSTASLSGATWLLGSLVAVGAVLWYANWQAHEGRDAQVRPRAASSYSPPVVAQRSNSSTTTGVQAQDDNVGSRLVVSGSRSAVELTKSASTVSAARFPDDSGRSQTETSDTVPLAAARNQVAATSRAQAKYKNGTPSPINASPPSGATHRDLASPTSPLQVSDLDFVNPPIGDGHMLSLPQLRWCFREKIRTDVLRPLVESNTQIEQFNTIVANYNSRCVNSRYLQEMLTRAQQEVESVRADLVARVRPPWQASASVGRAGSRTRSVQPAPQSSQLTLEIQNALIELGYQPGPPDGIYGIRTKSAVQSFRRDIGLPADGQVTYALLARLQQEVASRRSQSVPADR